MNCSRNRNGSISSASVSDGAFIVAPIASTPVGPPPKTPISFSRYCRSRLSRPSTSTSAIVSAARAMSSVIRPSDSLVV